MRTQYTHAAGQGDTDVVPALQTGEIIPAPQSRDEFYREMAVEALADCLADGRAMKATCKTMASVKRGDRFGPICAATKLMNANARIAWALAHAGLVERRSRTIVEAVQSRGAKNPQLNSSFSYPEREDPRAALEAKLDHLLQAQKREQERLEGLAIGCCI